MRNSKLNNAKAAKSDEFYTQLADVENEMKHYKKHFEGKVVYCNCDDPRESAFFKYFSMQFEHLGLKRLIASCYKNASSDLFSKHDSEKAAWISYEGDKDGDRVPSIDEMEVHEFEGNGDFRSEESIALLKQADIVVTNPPFSLFREYISQLMQYNKKFIVLGHLNALKYKEIWPYFKSNAIRLGPSIKSGDRKFYIPSHYTKAAQSLAVDENGKRYVRVVGVRWYTNLVHDCLYKDIPLFRIYNKNDYPTYDNYNAIEVSFCKNIPCNYDGVMGVPISLFDKYNPKQFDILGKFDAGYVNGERKYTRILIRNKQLGKIAME